MSDKKEKPITIEFAPIDTKDNDYCVISLRHRIESEHNITVMCNAEREYLERLLALQDDIRTKYQPQLRHEEVRTGRTKSKVNVLDLKDRIEEAVWSGVDRTVFYGLYYD